MRNVSFKIGLFIEVLVGVLLPGGPQAFGQRLTEFDIPTPASGPRYIVSGPDGNLWFTEEGGNKIARITTAGSITEFPLPEGDRRPFGIASGPDGNLWFTETTSPAAIGRITTLGSIIEYRGLEVYSKPVGIVTGSDGNLWYADASSLQENIGRISTNGTILSPIPACGGPSCGRLADITSGPDANLWFPSHFGSRIGRVTTAGVVSSFPVPSGARPIVITTGPDGNLWFTGYSGVGVRHWMIGRITTAGAMTEWSVPSSGLHGITTGPDGNLWFAEPSGSPQTIPSGIGRLTAAGQYVSFPLPLGRDPRYITLGPDGNLWFTDALNRIGRLSPGIVPSAQVPTLSMIGISILAIALAVTGFALIRR